MTDRLPPLNALRAFEAAGRRQSFTLAAAELNVTPGAVSRQIKLLEEHLSVRLFERGYREVTLTPGGREFLETLSDVFARMEDATRRVTGAHRERPLHIFASMMFTMRWLLPRLAAFAGAASGRIRLSTSINAEADPFSAGDVDAAIYLGWADRAGMICHHLLASRLVPICSPALLRSKPLTSVADLSRHTLLHSAVFPDNWAKWLSAFAPAGFEGSHGVSFGSSSLAYQGALEGIGIALGQMALIREDLAENRLVVAWPQALEDGRAYILAYPADARRNSLLDAFLCWLLDEVAKVADDRA
jgi:LysR family transcriptional regulator, glycine cleavage system transcriptional activator